MPGPTYRTTYRYKRESRRPKRKVNIAPSWLSAHWMYQEALAAIRSTMRRPEYKLPGPGMTKREIVAHLRRREQELGKEPIADTTISQYVQMMAKFGLLDAVGYAQRRRFFPPGHIAFNRKRNQATGAKAVLKDLLEGES